MDQKAIEKVLQMFEQSSVASMELETDGFKIKLTKALPHNTTTSSTVQVAPTPLVSPPANPVEESNDAQWLRAPIVGTYYQSASPEAKPYVKVGQRVKEGQVVCVIEAMKVMNEIKAHRSGVVLEIKATNAKLVEFNQALIRIGD